MSHAITGIWYHDGKSHRMRRQSWPSGLLSENGFQMGAHGGMQQYGVNYWETYSLTVNWISVRFLMIVAQVLELDTQAIDLVLAFPRTELEVPVYMELPAGMELAGHGKDISKYLLKLKRSFYGLKQASMNWHCKLKTYFEDRGFVESLSDLCLFISKYMIILVYVDGCIIIPKEALVIQNFISSLKSGTEDFLFT